MSAMEPVDKERCPWPTICDSPAGVAPVVGYLKPITIALDGYLGFQSLLGPGRRHRYGIITLIGLLLHSARLG
jgi:hypothetical protein